ncbi:unnamed protein product [Bursaphelenchus xylophilus]|nr:unnamed protein product [Bursaphelenchus xylophilus]CAG9086138.1 unnamed protein product [Bursaphelenchus xylophilus]
MWWLQPGFVILVALSYSRAQTSPSLSFPWCETIECTMLFVSDLSTDDVDDDDKFYYVFVPGEDILAKWGNGSVETLIQKHYTSLEHNEYTSLIFSDSPHFPRFSYAFIPELGRFQDIILGEKAHTPDQLIEFVQKTGPYSIYSFQEETKGCVDKYGYPTRNIYNSTTCMSIMNLGASSDRLEYYSGPLTWNRIQFTKEDLLLRWVLTNQTFATVDYQGKLHIDKFLSCRHTENGTSGSVCYSSYNIFQFASVCCCYEKFCNLVDPLKDQMLGLVRCPAGHYSSLGVAPRINSYQYADFAQNSVGQYCGLSYEASQPNGQHPRFNITLFSVNLTGENAESLRESLNKSQVACFLDDFKCPGALITISTNTGGRRMGANCTCVDPEECIKRAKQHYHTLNRYFGNDVKVECAHKTFYDSEFHLDSCNVYYDLVKERPVGLSENNNFYTVNVIARFQIKHLSEALKDKNVTLSLLSGSVFKGVADKCSVNDAVYNKNEVGVKNKRLFLHFICGWKKCDEVISIGSTSIVNGLTDYIPQCAYLSGSLDGYSNYFPRTGAVADDLNRLVDKLELVMSKYTGYCLLQYLSPDTIGDGAINGFVVKNASIEDVSDLKCPSMTEGDFCHGNLGTGTLCCLPFIKNQRSFEDYKKMIRSLFGVFVDDLSLAKDTARIEEVVKKPGSCNVNADEKNSNDECAREKGCFVEYLFTLDKNRRTSGCSTSATDLTILSDDQYHQHIHAASICQIYMNGKAEPFKDMCLLVNNGIESLDGSVFLWPKYTEGDLLRSSKLVCCCKKAMNCDSDVSRFQLYYSNFLDEENFKSEHWLENLGVLK